VVQATVIDGGRIVLSQHDSKRLLTPGATCWRLEHARRIAILVDGAAYFHAMKAAMQAAKHSILLLGWDFDPHVPLEGHRQDADQPDRLCDLFARILAERPALRIHILIWRMALPYAMQRRYRPQDAQRWLPGDRLEYQLNAEHPRGAAHHQKVLVVDDSIAFCGGSDFTRNRWDTSEHLPIDRRRRNVEGSLFGPRHDVEMAVDGAAAAALGDLFRENWRRAAGRQIERVAAEAGDPWPEDLEPDFADLSVGVSRTEPAYNGRPEVREVEALHLDAIRSARRWIYLENQYFTSPVIGDALASRLAEPHGPEVVVVCPARSGGPADRLLMDHARNHLIHRLQAADRHHRFRALAAYASGDVPITVHSKVMVVDDRLLLVGSANLNNRSLGLDTECSLSIEAAAGDERTRGAIRRQLDRLVAEHVASDSRQFEAVLTQTNSLISAIETLNPSSGRHLQAFDVPRPSLLDRLIGKSHLLDPLGAADNWRPWRRPGLRRQHDRARQAAARSSEGVSRKDALAEEVRRETGRW
jgi:phosphatidylserine/phosphatidylglycerophosphate/cardiolipin synthase-like enzyme